MRDSDLSSFPAPVQEAFACFKATGTRVSFEYYTPSSTSLCRADTSPVASAGAWSLYDSHLKQVPGTDGALPAQTPVGVKSCSLHLPRA